MHNTDHKTALTFNEKIIAAHLHYVQGIDQHVVAFAFNVNQGRVAEACMAIRKALKGVNGKNGDKKSAKEAIATQPRLID